VPEQVLDGDEVVIVVGDILVIPVQDAERPENRSVQDQFPFSWSFMMPTAVRSLETEAIRRSVPGVIGLEPSARPYPLA
jgi:hypothetical protein